MFTRLCTFVVLSFLSFQAAASPGLVDTASFQPGRQWTWLYSSLDKASSSWKPYFIEIYTVSERKGSKATITMRSGPAGSPIGEAHHKFVIDLAACERNQADAHAKYWTVVFYTKSLSQDWTLVSQNHKNLVFTEKFNCAPKSASAIAGSYVWNGSSRTTFQPPAKPNQDTSFYFVDLLEVEGVAAQKFFRPNFNYKLEFDSVVDGVK